MQVGGRRLTDPAVALVQPAGRKYPQMPHGRDAGAGACTGVGTYFTAHLPRLRRFCFYRAGCLGANPPFLLHVLVWFLLGVGKLGGVMISARNGK